MSDVLAAALIGAPVFRMRAEIAYRELGSAAHRAVQRLQAIEVPEPEIAALLGLRTEQVGVLGRELSGEHGQRVTDLRVWVDPVHNAVLTSQEGLDLVPSSRYPDIPMLPVYPPAAGDLSTDRFARAARARDPRRSRLVVDEVRSLTADTPPRTALQPGSRRPRGPADHVLLAPDTYLLVRSARPRPVLEVYDGELLDEELTAIAGETLFEEPGLSVERLTPAARERAHEALYATLAATPQEAYEVPLDPATLRDRLLALIEQADDQLLIVTEHPFGAWPDWLRDAYEEARRRGVGCIVRDDVEPRGTEMPPPRLPGCGVVAIRDEGCALAHCDARLIGGGWTLETLAGQACLEVHEPVAVRGLLRRLAVEPPRRRPRPAQRPLRDVAAEEMRKALDRQRRDLPLDTPVAIEDADMTAFFEQVERNGIRGDNLAKLKAVASGTVWERVLYVTCCAIADGHPELVVEDMRRQPPGGNIDLDVIVRNLEHRVWWVLDAKRARPTKDNARKMELQMKAAVKEDWIPAGFTARGLVVHPADTYTQLLTIPGDVLRATLAELEWMLTRTIEELDALE